MILIYEYVKELPNTFTLIQTEVKEIFESIGLKRDPEDYPYLFVLLGKNGAEYKTIYGSSSVFDDTELTLLYDNNEVE